MVRFIVGWILMYLLFAGICLIANWNTMSYADCVHNDAVQTISFLFGWIGGIAIQPD